MSHCFRPLPAAARLVFPLVAASIAALIVAAAAPAMLLADTPLVKQEPAAPTDPLFELPAGFKVERVLGTEAGSLINLAFNEDGDLLVSGEDFSHDKLGYLHLVRNIKGGAATAKATVWENRVHECQGILMYRGQVYAVGIGPQGPGLYRMTDTTGKGVADKYETLMLFDGEMYEHGPHAVLLGPDGFLYVLSGNFARYKGSKYAAGSPRQRYEEGDLVQPRTPDPTGWSAGVAPAGGVVMRCDLEGHNVEMFCGGFRNAYDAAFNRAGELFTFDSDMELDENLPWYRPIRVNHCVPGAEFGWRSGFAKMPDYFVDTLGAVYNVGRGSPTGMCFYDHTVYPASYRDALFMCDWSRGRILVSHFKPAGAGYQGTYETFLQGVPLNVTDAEVGPDGALYFATGGRDSEGGIFRVVWTGDSQQASEQPAKDAAEKDPPAKADEGVWRAIHQPQLQSAWGRAAIARVKADVGESWARDLEAVAEDGTNSADDRVRAVELMQLFGPAPETGLLINLSNSGDPVVRAKSAYLLGLHPDERSTSALINFLSDPDPRCQRLACESLLRIGKPVPTDPVVALLSNPDRNIAWAARLLIERQPVEKWKNDIVEAINTRLFIVGSVALLRLDPDRATIDGLMHRARQLLNEPIGDTNRLDLMRVFQLLLIHGGKDSDKAKGLREQLSKFFPDDDWRVNRELVRLLVYYQDPTLAARLMDEVDGSGPVLEKLHMAMYAKYLRDGWTPELHKRLLKFYESTQDMIGGNGFRPYFMNAASDVARTMPVDEQFALLADAANMPHVALRVVNNLPAELSAEQLTTLRKLDAQLIGDRRAGAAELASAVLVCLARAADEPTLDYLHAVYESTPERRADVAAAVAQYVLSRTQRIKDRDLLVRALPVIDGPVTLSVLKALDRFDYKDKAPQPETLRQIILAGLKLAPPEGNRDTHVRDMGSDAAVALLKHWTGQNPPAVAKENASSELAGWQKWFSATYPDQPKPKLPVGSREDKYTFQQIMDYLASDAGHRADPKRGAAVFEKASCIKCHKFGATGGGVGPDLSTVSRRFQRKEILESVLYPSAVISDQYASHTVITRNGLSYTGIVSRTSTGVSVFQSNLQREEVPNANIDQIVPSHVSTMPERLFNTLTLDEIADLFAFLSKPPQ